MDFRLMTVSTGTYKPHARILLTGSWLDRFGFLPEMLVTVSCHKDILTLKASGMGLDCYRQIVGEVRKQKQLLIQVFNWTRKKTETHLVVEGAWLERQGFGIGDILLVSFKQELIRMKQLPLSEFDFSFHKDAIHKILRVHKNNNLPQIFLNVPYLAENGFHAGRTARVTYEPSQITLFSCDEPIQRTSAISMPTSINVRLKEKHSFISFSGAWLLKLGYQIGDLLIIQYHPGVVQIQRLENHHLTF